MKDEDRITTRLKKLAFLSQKSVDKHIHVMTDKDEPKKVELSVIFACSNCDIHKTKAVQFYGTIFKKLYDTSDKDKAESSDIGNQNDQANDEYCSSFHNFTEQIVTEIVNLEDKMDRQVDILESAIIQKETEIQDQLVIEAGLDSFLKDKKKFKIAAEQLRELN